MSDLYSFYGTFTLSQWLILLPYLIYNYINWAIPIRYFKDATRLKRILWTCIAGSAGSFKYMIYTASTFGFSNKLYAILGLILLMITCAAALLLLTKDYRQFVLHLLLISLLIDTINTVPQIKGIQNMLLALEAVKSIAFKAVLTDYSIYIVILFGMLGVTIFILDRLVRFVDSRTDRFRHFTALGVGIAYMFLTLISFLSCLTVIIIQDSVNRQMILYYFDFVVLFSSITLALWFYHKQEYRLTEESLKVESLHRKQQDIQKRQLKQFLENADFKVNRLKDMINKNQIEDARIFIHELTDLNQKIILSYAKNTIADASLSIAAMRCEEHNIHFEVSGVLPEKMNLDEITQTGMYYNMLNNAVESALVSNIPEPEVKVLFHYVAETLIIKTINSWNPSQAPQLNKLGHLTTTKREKGHGYGTKILKTIAQNNDGHYELNLFPDSKTAEATILLHIPE